MDTYRWAARDAALQLADQLYRVEAAWRCTPLPASTAAEYSDAFFGTCRRGWLCPASMGLRGGSQPVGLRRGRVGGLPTEGTLGGLTAIHASREILKSMRRRVRSCGYHAGHGAGSTRARSSKSAAGREGRVRGLAVIRPKRSTAWPWPHGADAR